PLPTAPPSGNHVLWFGLSTSTLASGTRALRTQRLVQYSLDPVWNSYCTGPVSGHLAETHVTGRGYSFMFSKSNAVWLTSMLSLVVSPKVTTRSIADPFFVVTQMQESQNSSTG